MIKNFERDNKKSTIAEKEVCDVLNNVHDLFDVETFEWVGKDSDWYYRGDIKGIDCCNNEYGFEVKDDSRIYDSGNVLCEYKVWMKNGGYWSKGNMSSNYDYYCVVSMKNKRLWIIDFSILQKIYKDGDYRVFKHEDQDTYCTLLSLSKIEKAGALLYVIDYDAETLQAKNIKKVA